MIWLASAFRQSYNGVANTIAANIIRDVGMVVANPHARYVWRGHGDVAYTLHHSLHRRLGRADWEESEMSLTRKETHVIDRARAAGYDQFAGRSLTDVELLALLQHQGPLRDSLT